MTSFKVFVDPGSVRASGFGCERTPESVFALPVAGTPHSCMLGVTVIAPLFASIDAVVFPKSHLHERIVSVVVRTEHAKRSATSGWLASNAARTFCPAPIH